jgi:hypothetical protein
MSFSPWFRFPSVARGKGRPRRRSRLRLGLERLEDRTLLNGHTLGKATLLTFNPNSHSAAATGFIDSASTVDLFKLDLAAGDTVKAAIDTQTIASGLAGVLRVFDAAGQPIALAGSFAGGDPQLTFQASTKGTYYVGVSGRGNDSYDPNNHPTDIVSSTSPAGPSSGRYDLHLTQTAAAAPLLPDLVGERFQLDGEGTALWGDTVTLHYTVANRGGANAGPFTAEVRLSSDNQISDADTLLTTISFAELKAGESTQGNLNLKLPGDSGKPPTGFSEPQAVFLGLRIDSQNAVKESDETNNSSQQHGADWDSLRVLTEVKELEPNDGQETATSLAGETIHASVKGEIATAKDVDFFRILGLDTNGNKFAADLSARLETTDFAARLSLYDVDGNLLSQSDGPASGGGPVILQHGEAVRQPFYLKVESRDGRAGSYTLKIGLDQAQSPFQPISVGDSPRALAVADLNNDGIPDLITGNFGTDDVSVFLGNKDKAGTYKDPLRITGLNKPFGLAVGNFNPEKDNYPDLVVLNNGEENFSLFLGNGDGTFQDPQTFDVPDSPLYVTTGYFDSDNNLDLAISNPNGDSNVVAVFLGDGNGSFKKQADGSLFSTYPVEKFPYGLVAADFDGKNGPDLAVVDNAKDVNKVFIFRNKGDGTFQEDISIPVGTAPLTLVAGDFDGKNGPDLAVVNRDSSDVSVLLNNGDGTFQPQVRYPVGQTPITIVMGDFNGDNILDLATTNTDSKSISVLLGKGEGGKGDGTFQEQQPYDAGDHPYDLAAAYLNNDNQLDLIATNTVSRDLSLLFGRKDGGFQSQRLPSGAGPDFVTRADLNRDGVPDLVMVKVKSASTPSEAVVLLGRGDGTFDPQMTYPVGAQPIALVVADVNDDGIPDLVTANKGSEDVTVLLGNGDGKFQPEVVRSNKLREALVGLAAADFDKDGKVDLLVTDQFTNTLFVLALKDDGTFEQKLQWHLSNKPNALATGDFDGDGRLDVAVLNSDSGDVSFLLGQENSDPKQEKNTFREGNFYRVGQKPVALRTGDFDGDGQLDLAVVNNGSDDVSVLLGNGDGTFRETRYNVGDQPTALVPGDFDGDGEADLAVINGGSLESKDVSGSGDVSVLFGKGKGAFASEVRFAGGTFPRTVTAADFNGDGKLDLAVASFRTGLATVLLGQPGGRFPGNTKIGVGPGPTAVIQDDVNGDRIPDLITANQKTNDVSVLLGNSDGTFQPEVRYPVGKNPVALVLKDFNNDGRLDLAVTNKDSGNVSILLGLGDGTFQEGIAYPVGGSPVGLVFGSFTGLGFLDLATVDSVSGKLSILPGKGNGTFETAIPFSGSNQNAAALVKGDFNHDGLLDLAVAHPNTNQVSLFVAKSNRTFELEKQQYDTGKKPVDLLQDREHP